MTRLEAVTEQALAIDARSFDHGVVPFLAGTTDLALERLFSVMAEIRAFEEAIGSLWQRGLISGELHLGIGEEGAIAGVVDHLEDGDAMAVDHRSTPPFVARGCDLGALVSELLGSPDGLCRGQGGHMHLFDRERLAASSGIVGAAGPTACGFGLAQQLDAAGRVSIAFFGEGAANQGMLLESLNLAVAWRLPVVFVCKDSGWAITTRSDRMTGGSLIRRARGFGLAAAEVDGRRPWVVWRAAGRAVARARQGRGPSFLLVRVKRPRGHFEDDPLVRMAHDPREIARETRGLLAAALAPRSAATSQRMLGLLDVTRTLGTMIGHQLLPSHDPLVVTARHLDPDEVTTMREAARRRVDEAVSRALELMEGAT